MYYNVWEKCANMIAEKNIWFIGYSHSKKRSSNLRWSPSNNLSSPTEQGSPWIFFHWSNDSEPAPPCGQGMCCSSGVAHAQRSSTFVGTLLLVAKSEIVRDPRRYLVFDLRLYAFVTFIVVETKELRICFSLSIANSGYCWQNWFIRVHSVQ